MKKNLCIFMLLVAVALSANAQGTQQTIVRITETPAAFTPKVEGPEIEFETLVHNFGEIVQGANGDIDFKFRNVGSEPIVLFNVQVSCATCVSLRSWPREPIMPGQESMIRVRYNTQIIGDMGKSVTISSNARTDRVILRLTGNVNPR